MLSFLRYREKIDKKDIIAHPSSGQENPTVSYDIMLSKMLVTSYVNKHVVNTTSNIEVSKMLKVMPIYCTISV